MVIGDHLKASASCFHVCMHIRAHVCVCLYERVSKNNKITKDEQIIGTFSSFI